MVRRGLFLAPVDSWRRWVEAQMAVPKPKGGRLHDEFSEPTSPVTYQSNGGEQTQWTNTVTSGTLAGVRDGSIGCEYYPDSSVTRATLDGSTLHIDSTGNSTPSLYLSYDGAAGWPGSPADPEHYPFNAIFGTPVDFTGGGTNTHIVFRFTSVSGLGGGTDTGFNDFRVTLVQGAGGAPGQITYDGDGTPSSGEDAYWYSYDAAASINSVITNSTDPQDFYFPLAALVNASDATATFSAVQAIHIHACTADTAFDYTLDYIRVVPEPSTGLAALAAMAFLCLYRGRRRQGR